MVDFAATGYGRIFFDSQLPRLLTALERIAVALERIADKPTAAAQTDDELAAAFNARRGLNKKKKV